LTYEFLKIPKCGKFPLFSNKNTYPFLPEKGYMIKGWYINLAHLPKNLIFV
jgi:hypothetical protein